MVGVYVGLRHPLWLYWGTAAAVGFLPFGYFPGVHLPIYLPFMFGAVLAAAIHTTDRTKFSRLETAVLVLVFAAALSFLVPGPTLSGFVEFSKWSVATLFMIALLRLSRENMARFGRIFVYAAAANALWGLFIFVADHSRKSLGLLRVFGYQVGAGNEAVNRYYFV